MLCSACGRENNDGANFCRYCGNRLIQSTYSDNNSYGKNECKILREIRKEVARLNNIGMVFAECNNPGPCSGTCPLCEHELSMLNDAIMRKKQMGESVILPKININPNNISSFSNENQQYNISSFPSGNQQLMGNPAPHTQSKKKFPWNK